jgi:hypothetical protein
VADSGLSALDAMIEKMKLLGASGVGARVAARAAPLVDVEVKKTASAGTTPTGQAWKPRKDGGRPLVNAASHITTQAHGNLVSVTLTGPDVFHHLGLGNAPRRQVIPDSTNVPPGIEKAVLQAAKEIFDEITGGGS